MGRYCIGSEALLNADRDLDAVLVKRLQAREGEVMVELYARFGSVTYATVCAIVSDEGVAEDLVQEIFLRIWSHPMLYEAQKGTLFGWIKAVARNRAIDYLRSTEGKISQGRADLESIPFFLSTGSWSFNSYDFQFTSSISRAVEALTPNQREVIRLAYYEGMSQSEMALHLNQPLGTVKTWARTAMATLRREVVEFQTAA